jgi:SAM-dependent methyltransferase
LTERSSLSRRREPYPELHAGGFSRVDGTVEFFSRVQALLPESGHVLDLGAGRGKWQEDACAWRRRLSDLRGDGRLVIGADIDHAVTQNRGVDTAVLLPPEGGLPFPDASLAMVVSDWVFEHVADPLLLAGELTRTVAPGGWVCARTPNRWGYVGLGARLIPNDKHVHLLGRLQPQRADKDVFPVSYRLNARSAVRRFFREEEWLDRSYTYNPDPDYVGTSHVARSLVLAWQRLAPQGFGTTLHIFLRRRAASGRAS